MASIDNQILHNRNLFERNRTCMGQVSRFLLRRSPLSLDQLRFETRYANSYALVSEKNSLPFRTVMRRVERYFGTGPVGPNKYWEYPWMLANLKLERGMMVLDVGCGKSPPQFLLSGIGCRVFGIDPVESREWYGIDRSLPKLFGCRIHYSMNHADGIGFRDDTFDRVCCVSVIEHCRASETDDERMTPQSTADRMLHRTIMQEMIRVLKPGGLLVVTVDFYFPRDNCLLESNLDVSNLLSVEDAELEGNRCPEAFPGEEGFDCSRLIENSDTDIVSFMDLLQTSIGFTLRKKP